MYLLQLVLTIVSFCDEEKKQQKFEAASKCVAIRLETLSPSSSISL